MQNAKKFGAIALALAFLLTGAVSAVRAESEGENKSTVEKQEKLEMRVPMTVAKDLKELADERPQVHVNAAGKVTLHGAKVTAKSTSTLTVSVMWGSYASTWTVNATDKTEVHRKYGGKTTLDEITVGDIVSVAGAIDPNATAATVTAHTIKDWSIQKRAAAFAGEVKSVNADAKSFVLATKERGNLTVTTGTSTQFRKNKGAGTFADIVVGGKVETKGVWNMTAATLEAEMVQIIVREAPVESEKLIQGTLKSMEGMSLVVTVKDKDYAVKVLETTSILNAAWAKVSLADVKVGHTIRVYGMVKGDIIEAVVLRDISI